MKNSSINVYETKTSKALALFDSGCIKDALAILKTFKLGLTDDDIRNIQIAYECYCGRSGFYKSIGVDIVSCTNKIGSIVDKLRK